MSLNLCHRTKMKPLEWNHQRFQYLQTKKAIHWIVALILITKTLYRVLQNFLLFFTVHPTYSAVETFPMGYKSPSIQKYNAERCRKKASKEISFILFVKTDFQQLLSPTFSNISGHRFFSFNFSLLSFACSNKINDTNVIWHEVNTFTAATFVCSFFRYSFWNQPALSCKTKCNKIKIDHNSQMESIKMTYATIQRKEKKL